MAKVEVGDRYQAARKIKGFPKFFKQALSDMLTDVWHDKFLPMHFEKRAYFRYGDVYKKRFEKLRAADRRAGVSARLREPMVKTGTLQRNATRMIVVTGTSKSVKGRLPGTQVANYHVGNNPKTGGYNMPREIRHINDDELKQMMDYLDERVQEWVQEKEKV